MSDARKIWVPDPSGSGSTTLIDQRQGVNGLRIISDTLSESGGATIWREPTELELGRLQNQDFTNEGSIHVLPVVSREADLLQKLDAALQLAGVINRQKGQFDGAVLPRPADGGCAIVVNAAGLQALEAHLKERESARFFAG